MKIFDSHFHIIDKRFPLIENQGFVPDSFTVSDYLTSAKPLGIVGGAVVSGSFQGFDQTYLLDALEKLGPDFVGVTQLPLSVTDEEIKRLDESGVRAARFNLWRGGSAGIHDLPELAVRVYDLVGWHVEIYADTSQLDDLFDLIISLPKVVIDHLGLTREGIPTLLRLVKQGVLVKATGFGRLDFDPAPVIRNIADLNPNALLFGTDLPSTRSPSPFSKEDIDLIIDVLEPEVAERVFFKNGAVLYRPKGILFNDQ